MCGESVCGYVSVIEPVSVRGSERERERQPEDRAARDRREVR